MNQSKEIFSPRPSYNIAVEKIDNEIDDIVRQQKACMCCFKCICKLAISSAFIVWVVYAIIALSMEHIVDIKDICPKSHLWPCLCTMVGISVVNLLLESKPKSEEQKSSNILGICMFIAGFIWMSLELFNECALNNLVNYKIYEMLEILYWIYVSFIGICFIAIICICCNMANENQESLNKDTSMDGIIHL